MKLEGILLPVYSLPSKYGVGEFSKEAFLFIDFLKEKGIKKWYILPFNYDPIFISLDDLFSRELITHPFPFYELRKTINYKEVSRLKNTYFFEAFCNFNTKNGVNEIKNYAFSNKSVLEHCKQEAKKALNGQESKAKEELFLNFNLFMQMLLSQEWNYIKNHAIDSGVEIEEIDIKNVGKYTSAIDILKLNKKFSVCELKEENKCFKLKNFKKLFKRIENIYND